MIRRFRAIVCTLSFVVALFGCRTDSALPFNEEAQKELLTFLGGLESGMSPSSVEELFHRGQYKRLVLQKLRKDGKPQLVVSTPLLIGAGNWIAYIDFERDVISAVRVRTEDSANDHPDSAPPDRTFRP